MSHLPSPSKILLPLPTPDRSRDGRSSSRRSSSRRSSRRRSSSRRSNGRWPIGRQLFGLGFALMCLVVMPRSVAAQPQDDASPKEIQVNDWNDVEQLRIDQKFRAAWEATRTLRRAAQEAGDEAGWTRGLIIETQLAIGLESYETAVQQLRRRDWPTTPRYRAVLELFYARTLVTYLQLHAWDVRQRERVEVAEDDLDISQLTAEQIYLEASRAYAAIWPQREAWGDASLGELGEYIEQNTYPARIRGTFRDAVSYLWVELLADSSHWTPAQSNELWRLDFETLLQGGAAASTDLDLASLEVHPLRKMTAVLDDLEAWHRAEKRPEAALEARLERLRRLDGAFSEGDAKAAIRRNLESHVEATAPGLPWRAMAQHQLAGFYRQQGDLVAAHGVAERGALAHPKSMGGQLCRSLMDDIEAPAFILRSMALDGPQRRSLRLEHKNFDRLHLRAYPLDIEARLADAKTKGREPNHQDVRRLLASAEPSHAWTVTLPATPDFEMHSTYLTPPMESFGMYVVVASNNSAFSEEHSSLQAVSLTISDLVIVGGSVGQGWEAQVHSGRSGDALPEVEVTLFRDNWRQGPQRLARQSTDAAGQVRFEIDGEETYRHGYFFLASLGDDTSLLRNLPSVPRQDGEGDEVEQALIYTDRSVYRPGQTLKWKVVAFHRDAEGRRLQVAPHRKITLVMADGNGEEVATVETTSNDFGSAAGELEIPGGRLLGAWHLRSEPNGYANFQVEEYKRPTFEVELADPAAALRLNQEAVLRGEARYYFGLPVNEGEIAWRVIRQPVYPPWWGWFRPTQGGSQTVAAGVAEMALDGSFEISFTPQVAAVDDDAAKQLSYRYEVQVEVTNAGGETRSTSRSFRLGHVAVEAQIEGDRAFFLASEEVDLEIVRRDLDGLPRAGSGRWQLFRVQQPATAPLPAEQPPMGPDEVGFRTAGDDLRPRWESSLPWRQIVATWADGEELCDGEIEHGADGRAAVHTKALKPGIYRLRYQTEDAFGSLATATHELIVAAPGSRNLKLPLLLLVDDASATVGDTVRVLVHSGLDEQELSYQVDLGERRLGSGRFGSGRFNSRDGLLIVDIVVDEEMRGGFSVQGNLVRDHQGLTANAQIEVPWTNRQLQIELATFRDRLRPGQEETWKVVLRGPEGEALEEDAAELLAYMYDRSLDLFGQHSPPRILEIYQRRSGGALPRFNLGQGSTLYRHQPRRSFQGLSPSLRGDRLKFYDEYVFGGPGGGGFGGRPVMKMRAMPETALAMESMAAAEPTADVQGSVALGQAPPAPPPPPASPPSPGDGSPVIEGGAPPQVRSNFAETAFWHPQLRLEADGAISFSFQVPDSVTEWNLWLHAMSRDLRSVSERRQVRTVKELLVRPYLPRFFRQLDRPELRVIIDNAGDEALQGHLDLDLFDAESEADLRADFGLAEEQSRQLPFALAPGESAVMTFPVTVPQRLGEVALRVVAKAGQLSDGELRPLPVLPSRLHLAQSRFAMLQGESTRRLQFADLAADDDPSRQSEQLVVTVDGQLFYSVLHALPYLVRYPYSCTEQTLNRFLSTGIVATLYDDYPAVAQMAEQMAQRQTRLETWDDDDPNRKMLLEESPWLASSRGGDGMAGDGMDGELLNVLDPRIAQAERQKALQELRQAQTSDGGFPWWSGGPPSPYITTYILMGLSRAIEFDVEVPQDMVQSAWGFLHRHFEGEMAVKLADGRCCLELATYLNFVLSSYPDLSWTGGVWSEEDRQIMLQASFREWRRLSPQLKGYLALTLHRSGRTADARSVWESVMDSARREEDQGIFWAPEPGAWRWYNDSVEGHAFALRVLSELAPEDPRRHGLVQWLLLNKKLAHWKSTRATAEAIYGLVHYLQQEGGIAQRQTATVQLGEHQRRFVFEPEVYSGRKNQWRLDGPEVDAANLSTVVVEQQTPGFLIASATWHYATDRLPEKAEGDFFHLERRYFRRHHDGVEWRLTPLEDGDTLELGDQLEVHLTVRTGQAAEYVHMRDPRGAGFEPMDTTSGYRWDLGLGHYREIRDSGTNFFIEWLPAGEYVLKYRQRAALGGTFRVGPATLQSMYAPEFVAFSSGVELGIEAGSP